MSNLKKGSIQVVKKKATQPEKKKNASENSYWDMPEEDDHSLSEKSADLTRGHSETEIKIGAERKKALNMAKELLAKMKKPEEETTRDDNIRRGNAKRSATRSVKMYGKMTRAEIAKLQGKRNANLIEKDEMKKQVLSFIKKESDAAKLFQCLLKYGKIFSVDIEASIGIAQNGLRRSQENGYDAEFFIEKFEEYIRDYEEFFGGFVEKMAKTGANLKFLSWGLIAECMKGDLESAMKETIDGGFESLRFFYSKFAFYGVPLNVAITLNLKMINAVIHPLVAWVRDGEKITLPESPKDVNNKWAKETLDDYESQLDVEEKSADEYRTILATKDFLKAPITDFYTSLLLASGVSPYGVLQNSEYKQNQGKTSQSTAAFRAVVKQFNIIVAGFNAVFETPDKKPRSFKNLPNYKFPTLQRFIFDCWRPLFVLARVLRTMVFPQLNTSINSNIDFVDFSEEFIDLDLAEYFGGAVMFDVKKGKGKEEEKAPTKKFGKSGGKSKTKGAKKGSKQKDEEEEETEGDDADEDNE